MKVWGSHLMWRSAEPGYRPGWRPTASGVWLVCLGFCRGLSGRFFVGGWFVFRGVVSSVGAC